MNNQPADRPEIFLALAEKFVTERESAAEDAEAMIDEAAFEDSSTEFFSTIHDYLSGKESEKFRRLQTVYQNKTDAERIEWRTEVLNKVGSDEHFIDETVHWTYISEALQKESAPIQRIIYDFLPSEHRQKVSSPTNINSKSAQKSPTNALKKNGAPRFRRTICRAAKFVETDGVRPLERQSDGAFDSSERHS